ncbi:MAG: hypothetical protein JSU06_02545 [Actinobacteria bacterium]|nr:hypothetical protein [Actinomycetota bacterium]
MVIGHLNNLHLSDLVGVEAPIDELWQRLVIRLDYQPVVGIQEAGPLADSVRLQWMPFARGFVEVGEAFGLLKKHDPPLEVRPATAELSTTLLVLRADAFKPSIGP